MKCADDTLYCGITTNLSRRIATHNRGTGAKYTRARLPVTLVASSTISLTRSTAAKAEHAFKKLPRSVKMQFVVDGLDAFLKQNCYV